MKISSQNAEKNLDVLRSKYSWPENRPNFKTAEWNLDGGGREIITNRILKNETFIIVEIGVFLGSSVKKWLAVSPNVYVIAIDPWEGNWWAEYAEKNGRHELVEPFKKEDGPYLTFLSSFWEYKERVFPVRGTSPNKLYELFELGVCPDLIYFDSDKTGDDIEVAHRLFPSAILTGDDWNWGIEEGFPIRKAVRKFAKNHDYYVRSKRATWILDQNKYTLRDHINSSIGFISNSLFLLRSKLKRQKK